MFWYLFGSILNYFEIVVLGFVGGVLNYLYIVLSLGVICGVLIICRGRWSSWWILGGRRVVGIIKLLFYESKCGSGSIWFELDL